VLSQPLNQAEQPPPPTSPRKGEGSGDLVLLGEFGRAHGLRGEVRLKSFTAEPEAIAYYGPLAATDGRGIVLTHVRPAPGGEPDLLIARVEGVSSREAAEALNRVHLFVPRDKLPAPEEDEFLLADLVGLPVERADGLPLGTVTAVPNYGGGDLLEIAPAGGGPSVLLPFTKAFVPIVDVAARRLVADPPPDLFEPARPRGGRPKRDGGERA
jgi:16S rRNA processing protein RimM